MEMKAIRSGRLRAIGYDEQARRLRVELDNGDLLEYERFTLEMWRRFSASASPWSYYCDHIQEELTPRRIGVAGVGGNPRRNPLDELFS